MRRHATGAVCALPVVSAPNAIAQRFAGTPARPLRDFAPAAALAATPLMPIVHPPRGDAP